MTECIIKTVIISSWLKIVSHNHTISIDVRGWWGEDWTKLFRLRAQALLWVTFLKKKIIIMQNFYNELIGNVKVDSTDYEYYLHGCKRARYRNQHVWAGLTVYLFLV